MRSRTASIFCALAVLLASLVSVFPALGRACTAFSVQAPEGRLLAKGFDWVTGEGWIVINERGRRRSLLLPDGGPRDAWTSRFASVSVTTVGPGFPVSGMNEAGLAIEALVDLSAKPTLTPEPGKLTGLELIQYGLDRFGSVSELAGFVEEAGIEVVPGPARITLRASATGSGVCITLTGPAADPVPPRAAPGTGYGLADVRERLELAYAGRARFSLRCEGGEGHVELNLPG